MAEGHACAMAFGHGFQCFGCFFSKMDFLEKHQELDVFRKNGFLENIKNWMLF